MSGSTASAQSARQSKPSLETAFGSGSDAWITERFRYAGLITIVDATCAVDEFDTTPEAQAQVALADVLLVSKTDLALRTQLETLEQWMA
ncbi:MAG: GTP-binding protein, partial [Rhizobiales bacterium]|nr:GTP-binding protein [Hyphomicrobiales bacterium]